jgi:ABC-type glycerol-3-phosphate transport system permease component
MPLAVVAQNATRGPQRWYMSVLVLIMIVPVIAMAIALERYIARAAGGSGERLARGGAALGCAQLV